LPGAKPLARSFAMSRFAGNSTPGKTPGKRPFDKAFCILPGLLPLANYHISCSVVTCIYLYEKRRFPQKNKYEKRINQLV